MPEIIYTGRNVQYVLPDEVIREWESHDIGLTRINYFCESTYPNCSCNPAVESSGVKATAISEKVIHFYDEAYPVPIGK